MSELDAQTRGGIEKLIVGGPFAVLVGLVPERVAEDHVRVRLPFRPEVTTVGEMVHGGAIGALVDVAATAACWAHSSVTFQARGSTVAFHVNFLAPGLGCDLVADARVVKRGRSLCVCEVSVEDAKQETVARALVTYRLALPAS